MRFLILALLTSCVAVFGQVPADIIGGRPYCEPLHEDVYRCRDDDMHLWKCVNTHGRWECWRVRG